VSNRDRRTYHCNESADELKVHEVIGVDGRRGVDLEAIVVVVGVLEQTIHWVEYVV